MINILRKLKSEVSGIKERIFIEHYLSIPETRYPSIQREFLAQHLKEACQHVPFYHNLLSSVKINTSNCFDILRSLPIVGKNDIKKRTDEFYADYVTTNWKAWHNTGGSTGEPFKFPVGGGCKCLRINGELFCQAQLYTKMVGNFNCVISSVDGRRVSEEDLNKNIFWGSNNTMFPYGITHYSTMYLNNANFPYYLANLNKEKPEVLRGYPSGIYQLCKYIEETDSKLEFKIQAVYLTSENILDYQIELIQRVLGCPVWGQYGHSEASIFATRFPNSKSYECSPIYGVTEVLDSEGNHVKEGEVGEIVVTGFQYCALPFIRYRTGDLAEFGGERNGVVILNKLLGRSGDYIINHQGEKMFLVGFIFGGHLSAFNCIESWQIIQEKEGELNIIIVKDTNYTKSDEEELIRLFNKNGFQICINYVDSIPKTSRGKQPFMIQKIPFV